jgi:hypothetical protein
MNSSHPVSESLLVTGATDLAARLPSASPLRASRPRTGAKPHLRRDPPGLPHRRGRGK